MSSSSRPFERSYEIAPRSNSSLAEIRSRVNKRMCKANRINYGPFFFISRGRHAVTCTHQSDRPLHLDSRVYESRRNNMQTECDTTCSGFGTRCTRIARGISICGFHVGSFHIVSASRVHSRRVHSQDTSEINT